MGVEIGESKLPSEAGTEGSMSGEAGKAKGKGKGNVNIKFGTHGAEEPAKGGQNKPANSNLPKDAVDEWPEPAKVHSFYIFRYRVFEDRNMRAKLDAAEKELQKKNQARLQIFEKLKTKRAARSQIRTQIHSLSVENKQFRSLMDEKRKEMEPLQQALGKLRGGSGVRDRGSALCSSEEELNEVIKSLQYRIQHESIPLSEEKQILREIKQLEGTREKVIANAAERARIQESLGEKNVIQDQVKLMGVDLDGVRKEKQAVFTKIKQLDEAKLAFEKDIKALEDELKAITEKRDLVLDSVNEMRKQREQDNAPFYLNRTLLAKAKVLAAKKDVEAVKELSVSELEKFMSLWNNQKTFRDDYLSRILHSLDIRQLSKDGRIRNPGEKPILQVESTPVPSETPVVKTSTKQQPPKEDSTTQTQSNAASELKPAKTKNAKNNKEANKKTETAASEKIDHEYKQEAVSPEKTQKDSVSKKEVIDEKKLKEMKRQEEMAKRQQAEERKKKLAEKAAAKAAIRAQKEAEKKIKAREKKTRKKSGAAAPAVEPEEQTETVSQVAEPDNKEEKPETLVPQKNNEKVRHRPTRPKGPKTLPKAILKRKKATNYWVYAVSAALAAVVLLLVRYYMLSQPTFDNVE